MVDVYQGALLYLAATGSAAGHGGLFHNRNVNMVPRCIVEIYWPEDSIQKLRKPPEWGRSTKGSYEIDLINSGGRNLSEHFWCNERGYSKSVSLRHALFTLALDKRYRSAWSWRFSRLVLMEYHLNTAHEISRD